MLKKKMLRKILITTSALFALFLIYVIPNDDQHEKLNIEKNLEYTDVEVIKNNVFLMDNNNYLGKTKVVVNSTKTVDKIKELVEVLINGGLGENRIPSGFKAILPSETKILSLKLDNGLVKIDFSKELLEINKDLEEKMIEALIYTITSVKEVDKIIIYVEGNILTKLPKTGINLPSTLDRSFGINKTYDFTMTNDINQVTVYYVNKHNDDYYYVPVTKYLNDNRDKIKIIVEQLTSSNTYNTNLLSYLNSNTKLLDVIENTNSLELSFNNYIFNDNKDILEEVIYTICLSINDNYDVKEVIFQADNKEISKMVLSQLD
ncbi:MAG: GerMN domain-containing protein [Bacilli bacterium]